MADVEARNWRLKDQRYRLVGEVCTDCDGKIFPPRDVCPHCGSVNHQEEFEFSGKGEVYTSTVQYQAPTGFETPMSTGIVQLEEGPRVTAQFTDLASLDEMLPIGTPVEMVTRIRNKHGETGVIDYGYKFRRSGELGK